MVDMKRLIAVARGDFPADLVLTDARIVNVFTGEIEQSNVALPVIPDLKIIDMGLVDVMAGRLIRDA